MATGYEAFENASGVGRESAAGAVSGSKGLGSPGSSTECAGKPANNASAGRESAKGTGGAGQGGGSGPMTGGGYMFANDQARVGRNAAAGTGMGSGKDVAVGGKNPAENFRVGGTPFKQPSGTSPRSSGKR